MIYTHAAVGIACAALSAWGAWQVQSWRYTGQIETMRAEYVRAATASERAAAESERTLTKQISEARNEAARREQIARRDAVGLRADLDGLRQQSAAAVDRGVSGPATDTSRAATAALRAVLDQCAAEYADMARNAQGHANDALMLQQSWPR